MPSNSRTKVTLFKGCRKCKIINYQFSVTDTGAGIAPCKLDKIFTMYYQVKDNIHRSAGSGIGLAISKNLAPINAKGFNGLKVNWEKVQPFT